MTEKTIVNINFYEFRKESFSQYGLVMAPNLNEALQCYETEIGTINPMETYLPSEVTLDRVIEVLFYASDEKWDGDKMLDFLNEAVEHVRESTASKIKNKPVLSCGYPLIRGI